MHVSFCFFLLSLWGQKAGREAESGTGGRKRDGTNDEEAESGTY